MFHRPTDAQGIDRDGETRIVRTSLRGAAAIVGAVDAVSSTGALDRTVEQLEVDMIRDALADAGLSIHDVDCVMSTNGMMASLELAERLHRRLAHVLIGVLELGDDGSRVLREGRRVKLA